MRVQIVQYNAAPLPFSSAVAAGVPQGATHWAAQGGQPHSPSSRTAHTPRTAPALHCTVAGCPNPLLPKCPHSRGTYPARFYWPVFWWAGLRIIPRLIPSTSVNPQTLSVYSLPTCVESRTVFVSYRLTLPSTRALQASRWRSSPPASTCCAASGRTRCASAPAARWPWRAAWRTRCATATSRACATATCTRTT